MGKTRFFGREAELSQLEGLWEKRVPSLVTCRGRRRIGTGIDKVPEFIPWHGEGKHDH